MGRAMSEMLSADAAKKAARGTCTRLGQNLQGGAIEASPEVVRVAFLAGAVQRR
jgi:hypothetical protein